MGKLLLFSFTLLVITVQTTNIAFFCLWILTLLLLLQKEISYIQHIMFPYYFLLSMAY
ncbi:hypothetical protein KOY_01442 [Bacillus cereus VDM021]|nr:hypothetical protein IIW_03120 [Bacillus cereus VD136]EOP67065.1 hypothetical protein KOW_01845 [Bacillus cereus VDM006]EOQ03591.1 hypothetical protein KOY_01442 [Bacillus cereus VDM021]OOG95084.1 hypothetical protein BTH41_00641 [Bacillus mycoides]